MREFIQKYWRQAAAALIIFGLVLLAFSGSLAPMIKAATAPAVYIQRWFATRYLAVYEMVRSPADVTELRTENERLQNENSQLRTQLIQLQQQEKDNEVLYSLLKVARTRPDSNYVAAMVIGRDSNPFMRYIIIDQGSDAGLRHGMPVITAQGLAGRVDAVTASAARVQLITDSSSSVNVRLPDTSTDCILSGSVTGDINLSMIPPDITLKAGELILTSGLGGTYPSNILVGQVASVRKETTALYQEASVQPVVDFSTLRAVLVVTNFKPVDLSPLTESTAVP